MPEPRLMRLNGLEVRVPKNDEIVHKPKSLIQLAVPLKPCRNSILLITRALILHDKPREYPANQPGNSACLTINPKLDTASLAMGDADVGLVRD
jgi:hypothetical protein